MLRRAAHGSGRQLCRQPPTADTGGERWVARKPGLERRPPRDALESDRVSQTLPVLSIVSAGWPA